MINPDYRMPSLPHVETVTTATNGDLLHRTMTITQLTKASRKRIDPDISALKACMRGLNKSTSRRTLEASLRFLWDRYLTHPSPELPEHLRHNNDSTTP